MTDIAKNPTSRAFMTNIVREEYVTDIAGSIGFTYQRFNINPGLQATFPWLSSIAPSFEFYHFNKLEFVFRTSCGEVTTAANGLVGKVIMATDHDCHDDPWANKIEAEQQAGVVSGPTYAKELVLKCQTTGGRLGGMPVTNFFTRHEGIPVGADQNLYDLGIMQLSTTQQNSAGVIGELWVRYDVDLIRPQQLESLSQSFHIFSYPNATAAVATPFGTSTDVMNNLSTGSNRGIADNFRWFSATPTRLYYAGGPGQRYRIFWSSSGTVTALAVATAGSGTGAIAPVTNINFLTCTNNNPLTFSSAVSGPCAGGAGIHVFEINFAPQLGCDPAVANKDAYISFNATGLAAGYSDVFVEAIPPLAR